MQGLGALSVLPTEMLGIIMGMLRPKDVRHVSKSLRAVFDDYNRSLCIVASDQSFAAQRMADLFQRSSKLAELQVMDMERVHTSFRSSILKGLDVLR